MAELQLHKLTKIYGKQSAPAVDELNLSIHAGEFVALLGPSGCGKSTTLRMIAGLEEVTRGTISIGARDVQTVHPRDRGVGLAFENYALYPPLTVRENLSFNLKAHGTSRAEIDRRVEEISSQLHLDDILALKPAALSSGQKQRVNIARALVRRPAVLLLDEPLSHLDAGLRLQMRTEIKRLHLETHFTTVLVTHDQSEAMALADRIAILRDGKLQQFGTPLEIFHEPANHFVADFIGEPPMNLFTVTVAEGGDSVHIPETRFRLDLPSDIRGNLRSHREVILGIRPHSVELVPTEGPDVVASEIAVVEDLGDETHFAVRYGELLLRVSLSHRRRLAPGQPVLLRFASSALHFFNPQSGDRLIAPQPNDLSESP